MQAIYMDMIALVERRHRQFLEVVKLELEANNTHDINNVQAMILYNIGGLDLEMTVGELTLRGCYLGSNVSYNVKKMVKNGYLVQERSPHDRRTARIRLTEKGLALHEKLNAMHRRHIDAPSRKGAPTIQDLIEAQKALRRLEHFWSQTVAFDPRNKPLTSAA